MAWSLAEITERRRAGSLVVRQASDALTPSGLSAFDRRAFCPAVQAVRALRAIADRASLASLARIAAPTCERPLPRWPSDFGDPHMPGRDLLPLGSPDPELSCWARAALAPE
jgi:hypothetical protein